MKQMSSAVRTRFRSPSKKLTTSSADAFTLGGSERTMKPTTYVTTKAIPAARLQRSQLKPVMQDLLGRRVAGFCAEIRPESTPPLLPDDSTLEAAERRADERHPSRAHSRLQHRPRRRRGRR